MAKVAVKLQHEAALSKQQVDALPPGQAHWWLRSEADFVRLPKRVRGDEALEQVVHLEPGRYTLGVGPVRNGVREELVVEAAAEEKKPAKLAKGSVAEPTGGAPTLPIKGKTIVITGDLDAMERDAAKAWLVGLGAKVSTSVSSKTDYLLVGHEPGPKKLEKAAELGTRVISEAELRASLGMAAAEEPQVAAVAPAGKRGAAELPAGTTPLAAFLAKCDLKNVDAKITKLVGPKHFADLGLAGTELWGIAVGPRGGQYHVYIDLKDRPKYAMQCNCREWRPCKHAYALLLTAQNHFVPPAPPPAGHEETARYRPGFE
jgi:hypothetical protein